MGTWNNRAYIAEEEITPEQYKMFFARCEYGISYNLANIILKSQSAGGDEECVPCDQLEEYILRELELQIVEDGLMEGKLSFEGQTIHWKWEPEITKDDGAEIHFQDLPETAKWHIVNSMLDDETYCGEWYE